MGSKKWGKGWGSAVAGSGSHKSIMHELHTNTLTYARRLEYVLVEEIRNKWTGRKRLTENRQRNTYSIFHLNAIYARLSIIHG